APLVLIHDGGGTAFNYHLLGPLERNVFAISNPHFDSGEPWSGGLPEMAVCYAKMIEMEVANGPVIIGGWSLGGMIALELAWQLQKKHSREVLGIIMLDTPYPKLYDPISTVTRTEDLDIFSPTTKPTTRTKVRVCMSNARDMIVSWDLPKWVASDGIRSKRLPAVFLHAKSYVSAHLSIPGVVAEVDQHRKDPKLGWARYRHLNFIQVRSIEGNHFSIFAPDLVGELTTHLEDSCTNIE
ncbi:alpha/beta-hydrolase, partial [Polychaeton citri CBS 116435]